MKTLSTLVSMTLALTCVSALATDRAPDTKRAASAPMVSASSSVDNTDINQRDKGGATKTPQDQSNKVTDRKLLAAVRRAIVHDKSLSTMAHNAKIMVEGGVATLRGPVKTADEKAQVEAVALKVEGITKVDNQLDVKTKP